MMYFAPQKMASLFESLWVAFPAACGVPFWGKDPFAQNWLNTPSQAAGWLY